MKKIERMMNSILEKQVTLLTLGGCFMGCLVIRIFIERFLALSSSNKYNEIIVEYVHDLYFFSIAFILMGIFISFLTKTKIQRLFNLFSWGFFLIVIPPIFDMILTRGSVFWSFYVLGSPKELWSNFITFFGYLPLGIVYFGTRIAFFIAIVFVSLFAFVKTRSYVKAAGALIGSYVILFFMGAFPSFFYYIYFILTNFGSSFKAHSFNIAVFFGSPDKTFGVAFPSLSYMLAYKLNYIYFILLVFLLAILFWFTSREKFIAIVRNLRLPQIIYHGGMFFIGMGLGFLQYPHNFHLGLFPVLAILILLISVILSWMASVVINDINDFKIDEISNRERPLPRHIFSKDEYLQFGAICFFLAVLGGVTIGLPFAMLLIIYQMLAWFYSAPPYRIKKFPVLATLLSAWASLTILFLGYILMSSDQTITGLSWRIILLLMISYTISLPIKDFKDISGDKKEGIWTIPVIFGERKSRLIVATGVFISYILSVFLLNEMKLFFWALIFGVATFVIINNEEVKSRDLPGWVLSIVSVYFFILVWVAFV